MLRRVRKWFRGRRSAGNGAEQEDQEEPEVEVGDESASDSINFSEAAPSSEPGDLISTEGYSEQESSGSSIEVLAPFGVYEDPEDHPSGSHQPIFNPRERPPLAVLVSDFILLCSSISAASSRRDSYHFRLRSQLPCCSAQVPLYLSGSAALFPCSRCHSPPVRIGKTPSKSY